MIDQRVIDLGVVFILWMVVLGVNGLSVSLTKSIGNSGKIGCVLVVLLLPLWSVMLATLGGTIVYMLWGIVAPVFGWPRIDLLTSIAISWLSAVLIRGLTTQRVEVTSLPDK